MRLIYGALTALAFASSLPAAAQTVAELDCVQREAPVTLGYDLVEDFLAYQGLVQGEGPDVRAPLYAVVNACAPQIGIDRNQMGNFAIYGAGRLASVEARLRLGAMGVDMGLIDRTLELEWGQRAQHPDAWTQDQRVTIEDEIRRATAGGDSEQMAGVLIGFLIAMHIGSAEAIEALAQ